MIFAFQDRFPGLEAIWEKYTAMQERLEVPARTVLLQEGKMAQNYYFVQQGCLRVWFNNNGRDITVQFFFENQGVASVESFVKKIPSIFTIETIEPTTVLVLRKSHFNEMLEEL